MRSKVMAGFLLLAVSGAMQSAALAVHPSHQAVVVHRHAASLQHACCPRSTEFPASRPMQSPSTNEHRCCFLRGPQSSLPTSAASKERLVLDRDMAGETPASRAYWWTQLARTAGDFQLIPPLSIRMSVVLRN